MFDIFDLDNDDYLTFSEFARLTDLLVNGDDNERNQFSFALMDLHEQGVITFTEFRSYFQKVITHWSSLINSHVRVEKETLKAIFNELDRGQDG